MHIKSPRQVVLVYYCNMSDKEEDRDFKLEQVDESAPEVEEKKEEGGLEKSVNNLYLASVLTNIDAISQVVNRTKKTRRSTTNDINSFPGKYALDRYPKEREEEITNEIHYRANFRKHNNVECSASYEYLTSRLIFRKYTNHYHGPGMRLVYTKETYENKSKGIIVVNELKLPSEPGIELEEYFTDFNIELFDPEANNLMRLCNASSLLGSRSPKDNITKIVLRDEFKTVANMIFSVVDDIDFKDGELSVFDVYNRAKNLINVNKVLPIPYDKGNSFLYGEVTSYLRAINQYISLDDDYVKIETNVYITFDELDNENSYIDDGNIIRAIGVRKLNAIAKKLDKHIRKIILATKPGTDNIFPIKIGLEFLEKEYSPLYDRLSGKFLVRFIQGSFKPNKDRACASIRFLGISRFNGLPLVGYEDSDEEHDFVI